MIDSGNMSRSSAFRNMMKQIASDAKAKGDNEETGMEDDKNKSPQKNIER